MRPAAAGAAGGGRSIARSSARGERRQEKAQQRERGPEGEDCQVQEAHKQRQQTRQEKALQQRLHNRVFSEHFLHMSWSVAFGNRAELFKNKSFDTKYYYNLKNITII
jgi:hypothetical protein